MSLMEYLTNTYAAQYAASAVGSNTFLNSVFGGAFPLFALQSESADMSSSSSMTMNLN